jgi:hypothetical protein
VTTWKPKFSRKRSNGQGLKKQQRLPPLPPKDGDRHYNQIHADKAIGHRSPREVQLRLTKNPGRVWSFAGDDSYTS